jgi:hypothetical protein
VIVVVAALAGRARALGGLVHERQHEGVCVDIDPHVASVVFASRITARSDADQSLDAVDLGERGTPGVAAARL